MGYSAESEVGFVVHRQGDENRAVKLDLKSELAENSWLSLQLRLAMINEGRNDHNTLPLVLFADDLPVVRSGSRADLDTTMQTLNLAADRGIQILLLTAAKKSVDRLIDVGASVLRVGLKPKQVGAAHFAA